MIDLSTTETAQLCPAVENFWCIRKYQYPHPSKMNKEQHKKNYISGTTSCSHLLLFQEKTMVTASSENRIKR